MYTEKELWGRFLGGDEVAYGQILKQYSSKMFSYGCRMCADDDLVKDCIQEIFLTLWNNKSNLSPTDSITWYLLKCTKTSIIREQKKWLKSVELADEYVFDVEFDIETKIIADLDNLKIADKIKSIINQLPPRQKEILYLRFYENFTLAEIAELMDISSQSVYNLLQKAYKSFRAEWLPLVIALFKILSV
jgi:RNA polymerase sigma factor (sigma-70 family)